MSPAVGFTGLGVFAGGGDAGGRPVSVAAGVTSATREAAGAAAIGIGAGTGAEMACSLVAETALALVRESSTLGGEAADGAATSGDTVSAGESAREATAAMEGSFVVSATAGFAETTVPASPVGLGVVCPLSVSFCLGLSFSLSLSFSFDTLSFGSFVFFLASFAAAALGDWTSEADDLCVS